MLALPIGALVMCVGLLVVVNVPSATTLAAWIICVGAIICCPVGLFYAVRADRQRAAAHRRRMDDMETASKESDREHQEYMLALQEIMDSLTEDRDNESTSEARERHGNRSN